MLLINYFRSGGQLFAQKNIALVELVKKAPNMLSTTYEICAITISKLLLLFSMKDNCGLRFFEANHSSSRVELPLAALSMVYDKVRTPDGL
jgi:hypothetical protein